MQNNLAFSWWPEEIDAWAEVEDLSVSEWADKHRVLTYKAAKNGPWETTFNPVIRCIQDSFGMDGIEEITVVAPTQSGKTEAVLNSVGYWVTQDPGPVLIVEPNEDLANELSTDRVDDMISHSDALVEQLSDDPSDTTKKKKTFKAMTVYFGWAGSPTSLASRPCRRVLFDEVNKYNKWTGEEASPLKLGKERTNTFIDSGRCIGYLSTPTTEQGYITQQEKQATARFRYLITCPHCGHKQFWKLEQIKFGEDHDPVKVENGSWYECETCQGRITEDERMELNRRADWHEIKSGLPFNAHIAKFRPKSVGFQFNRISTPWFTFGMVAAEFLRSKDIPENLMNFKNSWMAEEWVQKAASMDSHELSKNIVDVPELLCQPNTLALTCGVDPGQGGFWYVVVAWTRPMTPHIVHYGFLASEEELQPLVHENTYEVDGEDRSLSIWRAGMDTGGSRYNEDDLTMTERAYMWIRYKGGGKTYGTKGMSINRSGYKIKKTVIDRTPKGKPLKGGVSLLSLDTSRFKDAIHMRLGLEEGQPGRLTFHAATKNDLLSHIRAEEKIRLKNGEYEWRAKGANHLLDCLVIAFALADPELNGGVAVLRPLTGVRATQQGRRVRHEGVQL